MDFVVGINEVFIKFVFIYLELKHVDLLYINVNKMRKLESAVFHSPLTLVQNDLL